MRYGSVVANTTDGIHQNGDDENQSKHAAWPDTPRFMWLGLRAGMDRASLKEIGALVRVGANKRKRSLRACRLAVAEERNSCRLSPLLLITFAIVGIQSFNFVRVTVGAVVVGIQIAAALVGLGSAAWRAINISQD